MSGKFLPIRLTEPYEAQWRVNVTGNIDCFADIRALLYDKGDAS
jgi:hypothetical protein